MLSRDAIVAELIAVEPHLARLAAAMDQSDSATVETLTTDNDPRIRANAVTLLSLADHEAFWRVLPRASQDADALVRLQAARSLENFATTELNQRSELVAGLLGDSHAGVRKFALRTAAGMAAPPIQQAIEKMATSDEHAFLRDHATRALRQR